MSVKNVGQIQRTALQLVIRMSKGTAYILVLALPIYGIVCCVLPVLPTGRPSSLLSSCIFVFYFSFLVCSTYF